MNMHRFAGGFTANVVQSLVVIHDGDIGVLKKGVNTENQHSVISELRILTLMIDSCYTRLLLLEAEQPKMFGWKVHVTSRKLIMHNAVINSVTIYCVLA